MLRQLTKSDISFMSRGAGYTFKVAVVYNGELRFVHNVHDSDEKLCFLEGGSGVPVKIADCEYIEDYEGYKKVIDRLTGEDKIQLNEFKVNIEYFAKTKMGMEIHDPEIKMIFIDPLN